MMLSTLARRRSLATRPFAPSVPLLAEGDPDLPKPPKPGPVEPKPSPAPVESPVPSTPPEIDRPDAPPQPGRPNPTDERRAIDAREPLVAAR